MAVTNFEDKIKAWAFPILLGIVTTFLFKTYDKIDTLYTDIQTVKETVIEVRTRTEDYKELLKDHSHRLRVLESKGSVPTDNTRVNYETYNR